MSEDSLTVGNYLAAPRSPGDEKHTPMHVHTLVRGLWFMKSKHGVTSRGRAKATAKLEVRGKDTMALSPASSQQASALCLRGLGRLSSVTEGSV